MLERLKPLSADLSSATAARRELAKLKLERLGDYRILREVGRGGMGVVYEAEQESLGRRVALKVLPNSVGLGETTLRRFELEARAAARLHHTNIVPVFGVGEENGVHYYVMQFIHGQGLDAVLEELRRLRRSTHSAPVADTPAGRCSREGDAPAKPRLEENGVAAPPKWEGEAPAGPASRDVSSVQSGHDPLNATALSSSRGRGYWNSVAWVGVQVADALQYAHDAGTLHRDVKPSNLMLDTRGAVWVTDFGLAKLDDHPDLTRDTDVLGTLRYMAPERFAGVCDARSDIYGIGLVLYELLTLRPAYGASQRQQLVRQITQGDRHPPLRPREIDGDVPRDLETIVLKAVARDAADRYATSGELAQDLRRFLEDKPVRARRTGGVERLRRWCRRNPLVAGLTASVGALLLAATVASALVATRFHRWAEREGKARGDAEVARNDAESARRDAELTLAEIYPLNGFAAARRGNDAEAVMWFSAAARLAGRGTEREALNRARAAAWTRGAVTPVAAFRAALDDVNGLTFDGASRCLRVMSPDGETFCWDLVRQAPLSVEQAQSVFPAAATRPAVPAGVAGAETAWTSADAAGRLIAAGVNDLVKVFESDGGREVVSITSRRGPTSAGAMAPDGSAVLTVTAAADHAPSMWSVPGGERLPVELDALAGARAAAFSPGGRFLATAHALDDGGCLVRVWAMPSSALPHVRIPLVPRYSTVRLDRAGRYVLPSGRGTRYDELRAVQPFSLETGQPAGREIQPGGVVHAADFSPDGAHIATATRRPDGTSVLELWEWQPRDPTVEAQRVGEPLTLLGRPAALAFDASGRRLAVLCASGDVVVIDPSGLATLGTWRCGFSPDTNQYFVRNAGVQFGPNGRRLVAWGGNATEVYDVELGSLRYPPLRHERWCFDAQLSPDGRHLATAGWDGTVRVWDFETGRPAAAPLSHGGNAVVSVRSVPTDGRLLLTNCNDGAVRLWDWPANRLAHAPSKDEYFTFCGAATPDGRWLVAGSGGDAVTVLDRATGTPVTPPVRVSGVPLTVETVFGPGGRGKYVAVAGTGDAIDVFRLDELYRAAGARSPSGSGARGPLRGGAAPARLSSPKSAGPGDAVTAAREDARPPEDETPLAADNAASPPSGDLVSGHRLDGGAVVRLSAVEWWDRWAAQPASPAFDPVSPATLTWHRLRAQEARGRGDAAGATGAAFHLARLIDAGAADWSEYAACARHQVAAGDWGGAVRCFAEAARRRPDDADLRLACADALRATGQADEAAAQIAPLVAEKPWARGNWWVIGPFAYGGSIAEPLPPESDPDLTRPVAGDGGKRLRWSPLSAAGPWSGFGSTFGTTPDVVGYAQQFVYCPGDAPRKVTLSVGSDDLCALWLNGDRVHVYDDAPRLARPDDAYVPATLRPGWNTLLAKVVNITGGAKLYVEILPDGPGE